MRQYSLDQFASLLLNVPPELKDTLPEMPPDEVQISWTGNAGEPLMAQTKAFIRAIEAKFGERLFGARILDYGCGWGRHLRLMSRYSDRLYGCDPWDKSIELCRRYGVRAHLKVSDYIPRGPVFPDAAFDLIYAFSVFTHLSERTAMAVMNSFSESITPDGMAVITIRDRTYWDSHSMSQNPIDRETMKAAHDHRGFAFAPHHRDLVDDEVTYGDTSMSLDYMANAWSRWVVIGSEVLDVDRNQRIVYLKPKP